jgi:glycosyltransferase involved in cell wall biosynthesis
MAHLLLIAEVFITPSQPGGLRHYEFAQHLLHNGHSVTVVAGNVSYQTGQTQVALGRKGLVKEQCVDGITVLWTYVYPALHRSFVWRVICFLSFMLASLIPALRAKHVDVVMGTSPPIFQTLSAWLVASVRRRPFLLEVRDLWPEFAIDMGVLKNPVLIRLARWLEKFMYARASHILVNSPAYRDYLIEAGIPADKITLIPNGVNPAPFDPNDDGAEVRKALDLVGKFVVTYTGALGMANDIGSILHAADCLRDDPTVHFLLVGDGRERPNLEALARELDLQNVTFTGSRPREAIPSILAASDACIATLQPIPMFTTTYPNKVFDYMAAGRPTILAIDGVIRQVVELAKGGVVVPPGDSAAIAEAIVSLKENRAQANALGKAARDYVVTHFHRETQAAEFRALIERLAQTR